MSQQGQGVGMDTISEEDVAASKGYETLGPAYFASRRIVERFMASFEAEHFKPLIDKAAEDFRDELWDKVSEWLLMDTESNLQSQMWRQVDDCVKGILSGERWVMDKYVLGQRYECEKIRAAVAKHIPEEIQNARIADLEAENAKLKADLEWARKWRS